MEFVQNTQDNKTIFKPIGWLDTKTTPEFMAALEKIPESTTELILDMQELEYISSSGLRQIVALHKKMNGNLVIINASKDILDVLKMTGFIKKINVK